MMTLQDNSFVLFVIDYYLFTIFSLRLQFFNFFDILAFYFFNFLIFPIFRFLNFRFFSFFDVSIFRFFDFSSSRS